MTDEPRISTTVRELSDRLGLAYMVWLAAGRGPEGMTVAEVADNLKRLPSARWLAVFAYSPDAAIEYLRGTAVPYNEVLPPEDPDAVVRLQ